MGGVIMNRSSELIQIPECKIVIATEAFLEDDSFYVEWAELLLIRGLDGKWIRKLAGSSGDSHFIVLDIVRRSLKELGLPLESGRNAFYFYACGTLELVLLGRRDWRDEIRTISLSARKCPIEELEQLSIVSFSAEWIDEPQEGMIAFQSYDEARVIAMREIEIAVEKLRIVCDKLIQAGQSSD